MPTASAGKKRELCPAGTHLARCVQVIDLGTQHNTKFDNWSAKVLIGFELPNALRKYTPENGDTKEEPWLTWQEYSLSLGEKANLRKHLEAWRGRPFTKPELVCFDLKNILDQPAMINVTHRTSAAGNDYSVISSVVQVPQGTAIPDPSRYCVVRFGL